MSSVKIGLAAIGSLIALTAQASAEVRYNGFPKLGYSVVSPAPATGKPSVYDAKAEYPKAEYPKAELPAPSSPFRKRYQFPRYLTSVAHAQNKSRRNRAARLAWNRTASL